MKIRKRKKNKKESRKINIKEKYLKFATDEQILNLDINYISKLNEPELRRYVKRLANIANQRKKEIIELNLKSYAVDKYGKNSFGRGLNSKIDMIKEINRINNFINSKTSTIQGINAIQDKAAQTIFNKTGICYDIKSNAKNFWAIFNKISANLPEEILQKEYRKLMEYTTEIIDINDKFDNILSYADELGKEIYINYMNELNNESNIEKELWDEVDENLEKRKKYGY